MKIHVTATMVPPPEFIREGAKPDQYEIDATIEDLPEKLKVFAEQVLKAGCFHIGGSVAILVQPRRTQDDLKAAVNSALAGSA